MSPSCWMEGHPIDTLQRHKAYVAAADRLLELERENAALKRLIEDPNAMHAHYLRYMPGWEVWTTERIRNMGRENERMERENTALLEEIVKLNGLLDMQMKERAKLRADKERHSG